MPARKDAQRCAVFDVEGVLFPEIWPALAERFSLQALRRTTRDCANYDELMQDRLSLLAQHSIGLSDIVKTIESLDPLPGAKEALLDARREMPVVLLSDTFEEFARVFAPKLGFPAIFCHRLVVSGDTIVSYVLRMHDQKRAAVESLQKLGFHVSAIGDSFNDLSMLHAADQGMLVNAPTFIAKSNQIFPVFSDVSSAVAALLSSPMSS